MLYLKGNIYKFNSKEDMLHLVRNTKWTTKHVLEFCDGVWDKYKNDDKEFCIRIAPPPYRDWETDRKSTRLNSSHSAKSRMPSSA